MVSGSILNLSTHLIPHMTLSIETCIGPLNTGFSISLFAFRSPTLTPEWRAFSIHCYLKYFIEEVKGRGREAIENAGARDY